MAKAVLISIRPEWVEKIASGEKTIELRKTKPKLTFPCKCYIYETKGKTDTPWVDEDGHMIFKGRGLIVGEFVCSIVWPITAPYSKEERSQMCLSAPQIYSYLRGKTGWGWHIKDVKMYDKPKPLSAVWFPPETYCEKEMCGGCPYDCLMGLDGDYMWDCEWKRPLKRPPQSWCYVEEQNT